MSDLKECPIPGCDFRGSIEAVKGHWGGKQDEDHNGKFHEAFQAYNEAKGEPQDTQGGPEPAPEQPSGKAGAQGIGGEEAPSGGTRLDLSALAGGGEEEEPNPDVCPSCSTEDYFSSEDVLEAYGGQLSREERSALKEHGRVCVDCGEVYG